MRGGFWIRAWCALALAGAASDARAGLIASESFEYTSGLEVNGLDGGIGWAGPWQTSLHSFHTIVALPGTPAGLSAVGGALQVSAADARALRPIDCSPGSAADRA